MRPEPLTRTMIATLHDEAGDAGDEEMTRLCAEALRFESLQVDLEKAEGARRKCAAAINAARANGSEPFRRVVA